MCVVCRISKKFVNMLLGCETEQESSDDDIIISLQDNAELGSIRDMDLFALATASRCYVCYVMCCVMCAVCCVPCDVLCAVMCDVCCVLCDVCSVICALCV
jgi:hypothetical protein